MKWTALEFIQNFNLESDVIIDVRSEKEFERGHLPYAINIPILNNENRHQVGICYKQQGQNEAIKLGHQLVDPLKPKLADAWREAGKNKRLIVHCWRGGLRSNISSQWMREANLSPIVIEGGYKEIRSNYLKSFLDKKNFLVLTGLTGSGKTEFLRKLPANQIIDLELFANHRGSAFGVIPGARPSQQSFENILGHSLLNQKSSFVLEDESRNIGGLKIPDNFFLQMQAAPYLLLERDRVDRMLAIYREYIEESTLNRVDLINQMQFSLSRIKVRLGGARYKSLSEIMKRAFELSSKEMHLKWIEELLDHYYDPPYQKRIKKIGSRLIFKGNEQEMYEFISDRLGGGRTR